MDASAATATARMIFFKGIPSESFGLIEAGEVESDVHVGAFGFSVSQGTGGAGVLKDTNGSFGRRGRRCASSRRLRLRRPPSPQRRANTAEPRRSRRRVQHRSARGRYAELLLSH